MVNPEYGVTSPVAIYPEAKLYRQAVLIAQTILCHERLLCGNLKCDSVVRRQALAAAARRRVKKIQIYGLRVS